MRLKEAVIIKFDLNCKNPYKILDIKKRATKKGIKKAFKKLSLKYHPDNPFTGDEIIFRLIKKAADMLLNTELRKLYDEYYIFDKGSDKAIFNKAILEITQSFINGLSKTSDNIDMAFILEQLFSRTNQILVVEIEKTKNLLRKYESAIKRLNKSKASSAIKEGLEEIINRGKEELSRIKIRLIVVEKAQEILEEFGYDFDPPIEGSQSATLTMNSFALTT